MQRTQFHATLFIAGLLALCCHLFYPVPSARA